ncbi:RNA polymerase factor sigma-54 [Paenibacillus montanisoli]|uniref:RNA polymerase sigma-54 factor n=1 Tax=Paenibacillus montanisoli TaxID=2081970 RepID=A0A328U7G4_9BACL|nr:RNA polymerase factor sigma-54 [Paenibacillus montanisoli]RAP76034.1 RNA polymerase sigma-54 factor [Paenibacillus montanisoli]
MSSRYGLGMFQQQKQHMHMSPQLQQAIKILQLPTVELLELLREELEQNPFLEAEETVFAGADRPRSAKQADPLDYIAVRELSLERHLKEQVRFDDGLSQELKKIVYYIIGNLDANGYLDVTVDQLAKALQAQPQMVSQALHYVQSLEPAGVGARNLAECLQLQLDRSGAGSSLLTALITSHLEEIAEVQIPKLAKMLHAKQEEIVAAVHLIKSLHPRPGAAYGSDHADIIVPDVLVRSAGDQFVVSIREPAAPRLTMNAQYEGMVQELGRTHEAGRFMAAKRSAAAFLIKCLEQRRLTLLRVTRAIVEEQEAFFRSGSAYLKPMVLRQIAEKVGVHESTVSRATSGKYAQTPWGTYALSYFFPSGFGAGEDDASSAESVKASIRELVKQEPCEAPYSDQQLARLLEENGVPISRRTVAKYREELGIASSFKRKRAKEHGAD